MSKDDPFTLALKALGDATVQINRLRSQAERDSVHLSKMVASRVCYERSQPCPNCGNKLIYFEPCVDAYDNSNSYERCNHCGYDRSTCG